MEERQRDLMGSRLFWARAVSKGDAVMCTRVCVSRGQAASCGFHSFAKGHGNTSSPRNLLSRVKSQFTNSAGPHLMWPH